MSSGIVLSQREREEIRTAARLAVLEAGALIRERIRKGGTGRVDSKAAFDFVTEVDRLCEDLIVHRLRKAFPHHDVISEEMDSVRATRSFQWLIDPLDGTTNFIHGFPMIAVSVALLLEGTPAFGWVLDPIRKELFEAQAGEGATCNGSPITVRTPKTLRESLIATGFPFRRKDLLRDYLEMFAEVFREVSGIRRGGAAALDLAYLAAGRVDGFWEIGLKPWDVAAGSLLVQEAGGVVTDFWGTPAFVENGHIVAGVPEIHSFLLEKAGKSLASLLE